MYCVTEIISMILLLNPAVTASIILPTFSLCKAKILTVNITMLIITYIGLISTYGHIMLMFPFIKKQYNVTNKLLINDTKTEFLIIGTRQQLSNVQTDSISVGESRISSSKEVRNLGSTIPSQCLLRSAKLPPPASTTSITSGVLESISLGSL